MFLLAFRLRCFFSACARDGDRHVAPVPHRGHQDGRPVGRVPGGVGEQVAQHLDDAPPVGHDVWNGFLVSRQGNSRPLLRNQLTTEVASSLLPLRAHSQTLPH